MTVSLRCMLGAVFALLLSGCRLPVAMTFAGEPQDPVPDASRQHADAPPAAKSRFMVARQRVRPNEVGVIPILEYHDIRDGRNSMCRSAMAFRRDLERLYRENYRPISLKSYLQNRIDTPPGTTPVILTFDDARESQFRYRPDGSIDPHCAVGILQAFAAKHPDFPVRATFFVLPDVAFGPAAQRARKMQALLDMGCEIGNHTVSHRSLRNLTDAEVQKELAGCVARVKRLAPAAEVDTLALPLGIAPRNRALLASGEHAGQQYTNRAVLLVGAHPAPSPVATDFDPMRLPRIQACEGVAGITYWLDELKRHPERRYVSDGDPMTVTVPNSAVRRVNPGKLKGAHLRTY